MSSHSPKHAGPRGYLKVTLSIITKDSQTKLPLANPNINDEIEGNLLLPDGLTLQRHRAKFVFKIYKGDDITKKKIIVLDNLKTQSQKFSTQSTLVQVTFAGITASTSVKKHTQSPIWNEQLIVAELFPPLCQRIKIQLKSKGSNLKAVKYLHLHSIANDQENGFLPTFGPAYVHFYKKDRFGDVYVGKVLMGLHTHLQHEYLTKPRSFIKKSIAPCNESSLWKSEPVLLFCAIISVQTIDKRFSKKPIRFEISVGPTKQPVDISQNTAPNITDEMTPVTNDNTYWYVDFKGQIPCISYQNHFPDLRRRFYNKNMITKISEEFKRCLDELDPLFHYERSRIPSGLIERKLIDALTTLATQCRRYIEIATFSMEQQVTDLDKEKAKLCLREMTDIEKLAKTIYSSRTKKKSYRKAQEIYARIALLEDHPQDCWPDILIYMIYNGKKIATRMIEAEDVIYSKVEEEIGLLCGKIHTISFDTPLKLKTAKHGKAACTMDLFLWIGVKKHMEYCFSAMPDTFRYPEQATGSSVPRYLVLADKHIFQCRAHIYQGKFKFAADVTGVSDFFIRVILNEESACTEGKLQLWVDIFRTSDLPPPAPVDVTPRKPQTYELRVVILNTEEVLLQEDDFFAGEKKSDIYIKGWLMGVDDIQCTDVHYRSLNGEGNFNWRFVFPFNYLKTEDKIVIKKAEIFHMVQSERKTPCKLKLQIWDNDTFSPDDFLGSLTMDLSRMPRGAHSPRLCNLQLLESTAPRINLFKLKRTKGWWPVQGTDQKTNQYILAGKLEAELHIVTGEEAAADPVGKGRNEPHALPPPKRPDTSFSIFRNPLKLLKYLICKHYKWRLIKLLLIVFLAVMLVLFFWNFPQYSVKKLLRT